MKGKHMKKRVLTELAVAVLLASTAAGCGGAGSTSSTSSGKLQPGPGFDGSTIKVGAVGLLSGPVAKVGLETNAGLLAYFKALNAKGGVAGKYKVDVVQGDGQLTNNIAVQEYNRIKGQVVAMAEVFGTPTTNALLPLLKQDEMLVSPTGFEASWVHEPNLLPVGPTYQIMTANALNYFVEKSGKDSVVCTLTRDDLYGRDAVEGTEFASKALGFKVAAKPTFALNASDYTGQISALKSSSCDAVVVAASPAELSKILGASARSGLQTQWIAEPAAYDPFLFGTPVKTYLESNVWVAGPAKAIGDPSATGSAEMLAAMKQYSPDLKPSFWYAAGWSNGQAVAAVLEQAVKNGNLTSAGVVTASHQVPSVESLLGNFVYGNPSKRIPPQATGLFKLDETATYGQVPLVTDYTPKLSGDYVYPKASE
jgi:ABC-type branched-subunit amino acid transport system substrate-binding protein